jgi:hypothetical protein
VPEIWAKMKFVSKMHKTVTSCFCPKKCLIFIGFCLGIEFYIAFQAQIWS